MHNVWLKEMFPKSHKTKILILETFYKFLTDIWYYET